MSSNWKSYEDVARHLLDQWAEHFGLERVEGKQKVEGRRSGTNWTIEAKGVCIGSEGFVIVECRRYTTSRQKQEHLAGLAYRILDTGAEGGIIVSLLGLQEGAAKIAQAENIHQVTIDPDSTTTDYIMKFLNKTMVAKSFLVGPISDDPADSTRIVISGFFSEDEKDAQGIPRDDSPPPVEP